MHNGSRGTNNSKLYLFKIFSCKLFSNHFSFNRQNFILTSFSSFPPISATRTRLAVSKNSVSSPSSFTILRNYFQQFFICWNDMLEVFRGGRLRWCAARENFCFFSNICYYYAWVYSAKNLTSSPPSFAILRKYSLLCFLQLAVMRWVGSLRGGRLRWCAAWEMFQSSQMCGLHPTAAGITTCRSQS